MLKSFLKYLVSFLLFFSYLNLYPSVNATSCIERGGLTSFSRGIDVNVTLAFYDGIHNFNILLTNLNFQEKWQTKKDKCRFNRKRDRIDLSPSKISVAENLIVNKIFYFDTHFIYSKLIDKSNHNCFLI